MKLVIIATSFTKYVIELRTLTRYLICLLKYTKCMKLFRNFLNSKQPNNRYEKVLGIQYFLKQFLFIEYFQSWCVCIFIIYKHNSQRIM